MLTIQSLNLDQNVRGRMIKRRMMVRMFRLLLRGMFPRHRLSLTMALRMRVGRAGTIFPVRVRVGATVVTVFQKGFLLPRIASWAKRLCFLEIRRALQPSQIHQAIFHAPKCPMHGLVVPTISRAERLRNMRIRNSTWREWQRSFNKKQSYGLTPSCVWNWGVPFDINIFLHFHSRLGRILSTSCWRLIRIWSPTLTLRTTMTMSSRVWWSLGTMSATGWHPESITFCGSGFEKRRPTRKGCGKQDCVCICKFDRNCMLFNYLSLNNRSSLLEGVAMRDVTLAERSMIRLLRHRHPLTSTLSCIDIFKNG